VSRANVEIVRTLLDALVLGDQQTASNILDPDIRVIDDDLPDAGEYAGRDGFAEWASNWNESWESWRLEPQAFIDVGDSVVVLVKLSAVGRGSGVTVRRNDGMVWTVRAGKAARLEYYGSGEEALRAAGVDQNRA
jgi:ketosteroid isomerase-like protein